MSKNLLSQCEPYYVSHIYDIYIFGPICLFTANVVVIEVVCETSCGGRIQ